MKKRFVTMLISLIACIACLAGFVACGDTPPESVAGKTYVFEKVEITAGASGLEKDLAEALLNGLFQEDTIRFDEDDEFTITMMGEHMTGTYQQDGAVITATLDDEDKELNVSGNRITMTSKQNEMDIVLTYILVE